MTRSEEVSEKVKCLGIKKKEPSRIMAGIKKFVYIFFAVFIAAALVVPLVFTLFPLLTEKYWPVLVPVSHKIERHGNIVTFLPSIHKKRECRIVDVGWHLTRRTEIINATLPVDVISLATKRSVDGEITYPAGEFELGPFQFMIPKYFDFAQDKSDLDIGALLFYDCNLPWYSRSSLGPFLVPNQDTPFGIIEGLTLNDVSPVNSR